MPRQRAQGAVRRLKTYSAQSGYVWEYYFAGQKGAAYTFEASATRTAFRPVIVLIDRAELELAARREVSAVEEYAVAKMSLMQAFDECEPSAMPEPVRPCRADFLSILTTLDLL